MVMSAMNRLFNASASMLALAFCAAITWPAQAQDTTPRTVDTLIRKAMQERKIPGLQVAILRHGAIVFERAYGVADIRTGTPMTSHALMPINSISKAFTGVAIMTLVEGGKLRLDAPVGTYLQGLPATWKPITLRQLLTHTSGLPEIVNDNVELRGGQDDATAWAAVQALPVHFAPGEHFEYCQTNYAVLQKVIEKISGQSFARFILEGQITAARMPHTSVQGGDHLPTHMVPTYTYLRLVMKGFETVGVQKLDHIEMRHEPMPASIEAAGGVVSTAGDLAQWVRALQSRTFLKKTESLESLWAPQRLNNGKFEGLDTIANGYALGWPVIIRQDHPAYAPEGGERAALFVYPKDDLTIIVLTNLMGGSPQGFIDDIAALYFRQPSLHQG